MRNAKTLLEDATKHYPDFAKVGHCFFYKVLNMFIYLEHISHDLVFWLYTN